MVQRPKSGTLIFRAKHVNFWLNLNDVGATVAKMQVLKELSITFSIDDIGTVTPPSYLKRLPLDELKIDRSFVRDIPGDRNDESIVETILAMANTLGLSVVAEGVENEAQRYFLQARGCSRFRGFLYSKALPEDQLAAYLMLENGRCRCYNVGSIPIEP